MSSISDGRHLKRNAFIFLNNVINLRFHSTYQNPYSFFGLQGDAMADQLPGYIQSNVPNPQQNRAPWYKNTAPTYAGVFLWFVFWDQIATHGLKEAGLGVCLVALIVAA